MAGYRHGKGAYIAVSTATASTTPKSLKGDTVDFPQELEEAEVTVFGSSFRDFIPGFKSATFTVSGPWSSTIDDHLAGIYGSTGITFHYGPEGNTTGRVKKSGTSILTSYQIGSPVGDRVEYTAEFRVTGAVTSTNF